MQWRISPRGGCARGVPRTLRLENVPEYEMSQPVVWSEIVELKPAELTACVFCLEPGESVTVVLKAISPVIALLQDWESYRKWERWQRTLLGARRLPRPVRAGRWTTTAGSPPFVAALVLSNPKRFNARVSIGIEPVAPDMHSCMSSISE